MFAHSWTYSFVVKRSLLFANPSYPRFRSPPLRWRCMVPRRTAFTISFSQKDATRALSERSAETKMFYSELILDRAEHLRKNPDELTRLAESPSAKLIPWKDGELLFLKNSDVYAPVLCSPLSKFVKFLDASVGRLFMGLEPESRIPVFGGSVQDVDGFTAEVGEGSWVSPRTVGPKIEKHDAALVAAVNGLMEWHVRNRFCGRTGDPMIPIPGGYSRTTAEKDNVAFPRIDPAIICLVTCGEYCLLGRQPKWRSSTRYSLLAGYLEVGETLEQAVAREVLEESNVQVDPASIQYKASQPWPFPQSLMVGFTAGLPQQYYNRMELNEDAASAVEETGVLDEEVHRYLDIQLPKPIPQPEEMEDVRWFHYDFIQRSFQAEENGRAAELTIPGSHAIAHVIIKNWMSEIAARRPDWAGNYIDDVLIDDGRFKYVLIRISDQTHSKIIVRGRKGHAYHMNVFEETKAAAEALDLTAEQLGGGRIEHDASLGQIEIYGYSSAFGTAVHHITAALCQRAYPYYDKITFSYSGY